MHSHKQIIYLSFIDQKKSEIIEALCLSFNEFVLIKKINDKQLQEKWDDSNLVFTDKVHLIFQPQYFSSLGYEDESNLILAVCTQSEPEKNFSYRFFKIDSQSEIWQEDIKNYISENILTGEIHSKSQLPIPYYKINLSSRTFEFINKAFIEFSGYQIDELNNALKNQTYHLFIHPDDIEKVKQFLSANYSENTDEYRMLCKNGQYCWVSDRHIITRDNQGNITGISGYLLDISERKRWEDELFEISERNKIIVENIATGIALISPSPENKIIQANRMFSRILGYRGDEIIGINIESFTHPEDRELDKEIHDGLLEDHKNIFYFEKRCIDKKGNVIWITGSTALISDKSGTPLYEIIAIDNVTDRKRMEDERKDLIEMLERSVEKEKLSLKNSEQTNIKLQFSNIQLRKTQNDLKEALEKAEEASKLKSEFLAIMSHELRTPLASLLGFSQLLSEDAELSIRQKEYANYVYKSGQRLLNLLNSLIDISILEAGKIEILYSEFDVEKLVEDIYILYKDKFLQKNLAFKHDFHGIDKIKSDPSRIRLILLNLIGNAIKFTEKGFVSCEVEKTSSGYIFTVLDTGIGILPDKKNIIFEPFRQSDDPSRRRYEGAGLGLSVCKKLVNILGGEIWLDTGSGNGSIFRFSVPEAEIPDKNTSNTMISFPEAGQKIRVLFAEDDKVNYLFFEEIINTNKSQFEYKGFYNGQELLDEFKSNQNYDVIILDIEMPYLNGIKCLEEIRKLNKKIPVIAITAFAMSTDREKFISMGFTDYMPKPLKISDFFKVINNHIKEA